MVCRSNQMSIGQLPANERARVCLFHFLSLDCLFNIAQPANRTPAGSLARRAVPQRGLRTQPRVSTWFQPWERTRSFVLFTISGWHVDVYPMDTATYAAIAMLPRSAIQKTAHPLDPELDFLPFDLSEIARRWVWRFYRTGPCNDI